MQCPQCQQDNPPQAKFCLRCGDRFALTCANCNTELPINAKFCFECGQAIDTQPDTQSQCVSPESYTPRHLAEKILKEGHEAMADGGDVELLERMRRRRSDWGENDFDRLYRGFGFREITRPRAPHRVYIHPEFPDLRATVGETSFTSQRICDNGRPFD